MKKISEVIQLLDEKYLKGRIMEESISFPLFFIDQKERLAYRFFTYYSNRYTEEPQMIHAKKIAEVSAERGHAEVFYNDEWLKYYRVEIQEDVIPEKLIPQSNDVREIMELMARVNEDSETIKTMVFQPIDAMSPMQVAFICQCVVKTLDIAFDKGGNPFLAKGWLNIHAIHVLIVLKGIILQTTFQLSPEHIHVIDGDIAGFGFYSVKLVFCDGALLFAQFIQCLSIQNMTLAVGICPSEGEGSIGALLFSFS